MHGAGCPAEGPPGRTLRPGAALGQAEGNGHGPAGARRLPGQGRVGRERGASLAQRPLPIARLAPARLPLPVPGLGPAEGGPFLSLARRAP